MDKVDYDRTVLVAILIFHQRTEDSKCRCGWGELGHSHAVHVAKVYEDLMMDRNYYIIKGINSEDVTACNLCNGEGLIVCPECGGHGEGIFNGKQ